MSEVLKHNPHESDVAQQLTGQDLMDMFLTMMLNARSHSSAANREYINNLATVIQGEGAYRDWLLRLRVISLRSGSLVMRQGARPYLGEVYDGVPTVTGIVTSFNMDAIGFCLDPGDGERNKTREVSVMPIDHQTLEPRVSIEVVSIGVTSGTQVQESA
jgi:hypothetical protein